MRVPYGTCYYLSSLELTPKQDFVFKVHACMDGLGKQWTAQPLQKGQAETAQQLRAIWVCVPAELFGVSKTNGEKTLSYLLVTAEQRAEKLRLTFKKMRFPPAP